MSLRSDGRYRCDGCGADLEGGGLTAAALITDLDPADETRAITYQLCRIPRRGAPRGCAGRTITRAATSDHPGTRD